jgi:hypothetical protein
VQLDAELVKMNLDGRLLDRIAALAEIVSIWSKDRPNDLIDALLAPTSDPNGRLQRMEPAHLIAVLMRAAGLTDVHGFAADELASVDSLARFVAICRENRTVIEETFGEPLRGDFGEKPVGQLNRFLRRIGLKLERTKTQKIAGRKIRYYAIPTDMIETMTRPARSYLEVRVRNEDEREQARFEGRNRRRAAETTVEEETASTDDIGLLSSFILGDGR